MTKIITHLVAGAKRDNSNGPGLIRKCDCLSYCFPEQYLFSFMMLYQFTTLELVARSSSSPQSPGKMHVLEQKHKEKMMSDGHVLITTTNLLGSFWRRMFYTVYENTPMSFTLHHILFKKKT